MLLFLQPGGARSSDDEGPTKGLRVFPHRTGGGNVLPHPQFPVDSAQARDQSVVCTWSSPLVPSRSSRFFMTLLNSHHLAGS